jgi:ABC-2 type transport system ATP-binding protein
MNDLAVPIMVRDLAKTYREGWFSRDDVQALRGVSFHVQRGEIFGLLGPNGAGKTTLIKILLGIVKRSRGEASLLGRAPGDRQGRRRVGYLPENLRIPRHHTGDTALLYFGGLSGLSPHEVRRRRDEMLELVGLTGWGHVGVRKYSKGMQQRLGLAQALLHDPEMLILDEPTDGVDPVGRSEMRSLLVRLKQAGKTIFLNSHHLQEIELVCDRVAILQHGLVRRAGSVADLTLTPETELTLTLGGDDATIRRAIGTRAIRRWIANDTADHVVTLRITDQTDANELIDALRAAAVSIAAISKHRQTLEEAFLAILAEEPTSP